MSSISSPYVVVILTAKVMLSPLPSPLSPLPFPSPSSLLPPLSFATTNLCPHHRSKVRNVLWMEDIGGLPPYALVIGNQVSEGGRGEGQRRGRGEREQREREQRETREEERDESRRMRFPCSYTSHHTQCLN